MILTRFKTGKDYVLGVMKDDVGGTYFTLENKKTLIPAGEYQVTMCHSPKFGRDLPLLSNSKVPASRGIRIHGGVTAKNSQGCILVGNTCSLLGKLTESYLALEQLCNAIPSGDETVLVIK